MKRTIDCHDENDRFMAYCQNRYMRSAYTESMDFGEYFWRYGKYLQREYERTVDK